MIEVIEVTKTDDNHCEYCGSARLKTEPLKTPRGNGNYQKVVCQDCGETLRTLYKGQKISDL